MKTRAPREYVLDEIREFANKNDVCESAILWVGEEINKSQGNAVPGFSDDDRGVNGRPARPPLAAAAASSGASSRTMGDRPLVVVPIAALVKNRGSDLCGRALSRVVVAFGLPWLIRCCCARRSDYQPSAGRGP
jgi:hypothetical protein